MILLISRSCWREMAGMSLNKFGQISGQTPTGHVAAASWPSRSNRSNSAEGPDPKLLQVLPVMHPRDVVFVVVHRVAWFEVRLVATGRGVARRERSCGALSTGRPLDWERVVDDFLASLPPSVQDAAARQGAGEHYGVNGPGATAGRVLRLSRRSRG